MSKRVVFDIEIFPNYALFLFKDLATGWYKGFEYRDANEKPDYKAIATYMQQCDRIYTYNGCHYDFPLFWACFGRGCTVAQMKDMSDKLINNRSNDLNSLWAKLQYLIATTDNEKLVKFYNDFVKPMETRHFDLMAIMFQPKGFKKGLKQMGFEMGMDEVIVMEAASFDKPVDDEKIKRIIDYCKSDLNITAALVKKKSAEIELRANLSKLWDLHLNSCHDSTIANRYAIKMLDLDYNRDRPCKINGNGTIVNPYLKDKYRYETPPYVSFQTPDLQKLLADIEAAEFTLINGGERQGKVSGDVIGRRELNIGGFSITVSQGGLHSNDEKGLYENLIDIDVTSYYPAIIVSLGLAPRHLKHDEFLTFFQNLLTDRVAAKKAKDTVKADGLKIVLNSIYGKFSNQYTLVYDPKLGFAVTMTGQLCLMMLIEMMVLAGVQVISANTDGVTVSNADNAKVVSIVDAWEEKTKFKMEYTEYTKVFYENVNNYVAYGKDGKIKYKGASFKQDSLKVAPIVKKCSVEWRLHGQVAAQKMFAAMMGDVSNFLVVGKFNDQQIIDSNGVIYGKAARWYYSTFKGGVLFGSVRGNSLVGTSGYDVSAVLDKISHVPHNTIDMRTYWAMICREVCKNG